MGDCRQITSAKLFLLRLVEGWDSCDGRLTHIVIAGSYEHCGVNMSKLWNLNGLDLAESGL